MTEKEKNRLAYFQSLSSAKLAALPLAERMEYVQLKEKAAGVHFTQTGQVQTTGSQYAGQISPGQPVTKPRVTPTPAPTPAPKATPTPTPRVTPTPTPPLEPWPNITPTPGLSPIEIPEAWMPQVTGAETMTLNMLMDYVINTMKAAQEPYQDPKTGRITMMSMYTNDDIVRAINQIKESVDLTGFGPHTPYYGDAQAYYGGITQTQAGAGGAAGGGQLSPAEYLDFQLDQQQQALQRELAMLPYQNLTADRRAQIEQQIADRQADLDYQRQQLALQKQEMWLPYQEVPAGQEAQLALQRELAMLPYQQMTKADQAAYELEKQQYAAQLAAEPKSWLEYAAYTGQQPVVQPWMQPLMPQQYQQLGAGQPIPGYQGTAGMGGMPELTTPSRQYQARMGPTAQEQYYGYQQARTGARPEESEFRLWSGAPPSGSYGGLRYGR